MNCTIFFLQVMLQVLDYVVHILNAEIELIQHVVLFFSLFSMKLNLLNIGLATLLIFLQFCLLLRLNIPLEIIKNLGELSPK